MGVDQAAGLCGFQLTWQTPSQQSAESDCTGKLPLAARFDVLIEALRGAV